jgi:hypothetical protein
MILKQYYLGCLAHASTTRRCGGAARTERIEHLLAPTHTHILRALPARSSVRWLDLARCDIGDAEAPLCGDV